MPEQINIENRQVQLGKPSPFKNKHHTLKAKEKIGRANLGKKRSPETIEKQRKAKLGKKHSPERIERHRQKVTGKHWKLSEESVEKNRQSQLRRFLDPLEREKQSKSQIERFKDLNERLKIGQAQLHLFSALDRLVKNKYCILFTKKLREEVRIRDSYQCQFPGCLCTQLESLTIWKQSLHVHHIHYDKPNCYPDLICLCLKHNVVVNTDRLYWESLFMNILNNRDLLLWTRKINFKSDNIHLKL